MSKPFAPEPLFVNISRPNVTRPMRSSTLQGETGKATCKFPSLTAWNFTQCYSFICKFSGLIVKAQTQCIVDCCHCLIFAIKNNLQALKLKSEKKKEFRCQPHKPLAGNLVIFYSRSHVKLVKKSGLKCCIFRNIPCHLLVSLSFYLKRK